LIASSNNEADHLEWYGLVESKLRHLVGTLERNDHIELAHIWPQSSTPLCAVDKPTTQWFIGLIFKKSNDNVNVDLTYDILNFTETGKKLSLNLNQASDSD